MNPTDRKVVAVFGSSQARPGDGTYDSGVECGRLLAEAGFAVATGGYGGVMAAVCEGAAAVGGPTIGVTAPSVFPGRSGANKWVQHEIPAEDLVSRIGLLTTLADGYIAMPGSIGTLAELIIAWNLAYVAPLADVQFGPVVAVGETWTDLIPDLTARLATDGGLVTVVPDVAAAVATVAAELGPA